MSVFLFNSQYSRAQYSTLQYSAVYRLCVVAFSLHYSLEHLTCCYSMSVVLFCSQYSTVQSCIQIVYSGFQFGSADSTVQ